MRDAFIKQLIIQAQEDESIYLVTGDLGYSVLDEFQTKFPNRFINSGIAEQSMMGLAAGLASTDKKVFVYSIGNFSTLRCLEQIRNDVCSMKLNVTVVSVGAGYAYGSQGYTHHAIEDISVMRAMHGMNVYSPCDPQETQKVTQLICGSAGPAYLRLGKSNESAIHSRAIDLAPNKFIEIVPGSDGTILFTGSIGRIAIQAASELASLGINIAVASCPIISAQDVEYLRVASERGLIVTLEEHILRGGFGSSILETLSCNRIQARVSIVASESKEISTVGNQEYLWGCNELTVENVASRFLPQDSR
jgi:transketolase